MAERKTTNRTPRATPRSSAKKQTPPRKKPLGVLFWMVFIIVIVGLFMVNREIITRNIQNTGFLDRILNRSAQPANTEDLPELVEIPPEDIPHVVIENPPIEEPPPVDIRPENPPEEISDPVTPPVAATPPPVQTPPQEKRDRSLYFMKLDNDGTIVRTQVSRALPVSNSPMMDVLSVLIQGPNADERKKGLESLIPEGTEILSATVRGSTAYISFSENFQFNTYGVEGYAAQLRQIVWTVTEFPNINDVQILLEGRRIDYLGEGIWIGSPLSREML